MSPLKMTAWEATVAQVQLFAKFEKKFVRKIQN